MSWTLDPVTAEIDVGSIRSNCVVGIASSYGSEGPKSNPGGGEIFRIRPDRSWGPRSLP